MNDAIGQGFKRGSDSPSSLDDKTKKIGRDCTERSSSTLLVILFASKESARFTGAEHELSVGLSRDGARS